MPKIKAIGYICVNKAGKAHIPVIIRERCETQKIPFLISAYSVLLFNPNLSLDSILKSIDILKEELRLAGDGMGSEKRK